MDTMKLWDSVQATDPKYTKQFSRGGGFKGTATNATFLAKRATEKFGPMGTGWGLTVVDERVLQGAPVIVDGQVVGHEQVHRVHARLWYVLDGQRGEIEQFGQTQFVGRNKNGWFTDEEAPKKSLTDAMSKCLSLLGFSADIHLGLYDDNKYVTKLREKFDAITEDQAKEIHERLKDTDSDVAAFLGWLEVESVEAIPSSLFNKAKSALAQKAAQMAKDAEKKAA